MGTDDGNTGSRRFNSVRQRLSSPEVGGVESPDVRERLPSLDIEGRLSTASVRERLSRRRLANRLPRPAVRERLPDIGLRERLGRADGEPRLSSDAVRDRLARTDLESLSTPDASARLSAPDVGGGLSTPDVEGRVTAPDVGDRLSTPNVGGRISRPRVRERFPRPQVRERLSSTGVGELASATVDRASVRLPDTADFETPTPEPVEQHLSHSQTTTPEYFVGVVPEPHEAVVERLEGSPFGRSYVTSPKTLSDDDLGLEREASSIWVYRSWSLSHFQLHVPLFEIPDEEATYVFYHHEYNWLRHPVVHLDAGYLNPEWQRERVVELLESARLSVEAPGDIDGEQFAVASAYCTGGEAA